MTAFVNIRMTSEKVLIDPHLKVLVDRLIMLNPKLVFSQPKQVSEFEYDVSFNWSKQKEKHSAPEGFKYVRTMSVYEDNEKVGVVGVDQDSKSDTGYICELEMGLHRSRTARLHAEIASSCPLSNNSSMLRFLNVFLHSRTATSIFLVVVVLRLPRDLSIRQFDTV